MGHEHMETEKKLWQLGSETGAFEFPREPRDEAQGK